MLLFNKTQSVQRGCDDVGGEKKVHQKMNERNAP